MSMKIIALKLLAFVLALLLVLPSFAGGFPRTAQAQLVVYSPVEHATQLLEYEALMQLRIKDAGLAGGAFSLDGLAWLLAKTAISTMTRSLVNWINSGFQGSPAFATDLRQNLLRLGDAYAARFFDEITDTIIDSPHGDQIATAIRTSYYLSTGGSFYVRNPYTLNQYSSNPVDFLNGDFSQGGLSAWFSTVMNAQNNPYGALNLAAQELDSRLATAGARRITELNWGRGFLSWRGDCTETASQASAKYAAANPGVSAGVNELVAAQNVSLADKEGCLNYGIKTPGSVIAGQIDATLPKGMEGLVTADEIDEIIGALFQQLVVQVIGKTGLLGVSAPASGGGRPFIDVSTDPNTPSRDQQSNTNPDTLTQLASYEASWKTIGEAADKALVKCPESAYAHQARRDSISAQARVDAVRQALAQPGASESQIGTLMPTDAQVAEAKVNAGSASVSAVSKLEAIQAARSCPKE